MNEVGLVVLLGGLFALAVRLAARAERRACFTLTFPRGMRSEHAVAAVRSVIGLRPVWWRGLFGAPAVVLEVHGSNTGISHMLHVPVSRAEAVLAAWRAAVPGLRIDDRAELARPRVALAREFRAFGTGPLRTDIPIDTNAAVLAALQPLRRTEGMIFQYVMSPGGWLGRWWRRVVEQVSRRVEADTPRQPVEPELAAVIRVGVTASSSARVRRLIARAAGALQPTGTEAARLRRGVVPSAIVASRLRRLAGPGRAVLGADELAGIIAAPLSDAALPGLALAGARELPAPASVPRRGLVLGDSTVTGPPRPVAISLSELRRGLHICAPTGAGKSTVLLNLAAHVMASGQGLVLIDSKGDLAADVLDRVPPRRRGEVIAFDPADLTQPVGFNLIGGSETSDLIVDHVVGQFRARYGAAGLGPRSEDVLRSCLMTLAAHPGFTLCEVEPLLTTAHFRHRLIGDLDEPVLEGFWGWFASLSEAARAEAVAPLLNKLRTYTLRRRVRAVIGQDRGLDLARVLSDGQILVASLARGLVGEDAAGLIGAAMTARLWTAIQGRAGLPPEARRPVTVICDEFQDFAALTTSFSDALAQSRGYRVGWIVAHQHLAQLDTATRQTVLANCRSRLVMQTTATDAAVFAREFAPLLEAADLQGLPAYEGYAAVSTGAAVAPAASIRTRPAPAALGSAAAVRQRSRERYGMTPADVDAAMRSRVIGRQRPAPVGGRRRG